MNSKTKKITINRPLSPRLDVLIRVYYWENKKEDNQFFYRSFISRKESQYRDYDGKIQNEGADSSVDIWIELGKINIVAVYNAKRYGIGQWSTDEYHARNIYQHSGGPENSLNPITSEDAYEKKPSLIGWL